MEAIEISAASVPHTERVSNSLYQADAQTRSSAMQTQADVSYSYLHLLDRLHARLTPALPPAVPSMSEHSYDGILRLLLLQPLEIRLLILSWLEGKDLLSLRSVSHVYHDMIHHSERALCIALAERIAKAHDLSGISLTVPNYSAFLRLSRQYSAICKLATTVATRISGYVALTAHASGSIVLEHWRKKAAARLRGRLARALIILQQYLDYLLEVLANNEEHLRSLTEDDYTSLHNIFDFDQQKFLADYMSGLTETDFVDVTAALGIFSSTCKARSVPFELKSSAFPFPSIRKILVYKGLAPFAELLSVDTTREQQANLLRRLSTSIAQLRVSATPAWTGPLLDTIHHIDTDGQSRHLHYDVKRSSRARDSFVGQQDIWDRAARVLMMSKLGRFPNLESPSIWITNVVLADEKETGMTLKTWDKAER